MKRVHGRMVVSTVVVICALGSLSSFASGQVTQEGEFVTLPSSNLRPVGVVELPFKTYHVQGLAVTDDWYFLSAVDEAGGHGWLWKIDRATLKVLAEMDLATESPDGVEIIHPGGIHYDGKFLWVPVAGYTRDGPSIIYRIDPLTMAITDSFWFADHIGGIVSNGNDRFYLANWDTVYWYVCDQEGKVIKNFINPGLAQRMGYVCAYQDFDLDPETGLLLGSGDTRKPYAEPEGYKFGFPYFHGYADEFGMLDWIDPDTGRVVQRLLLGYTGYGRSRTRLGREGFAYYEGVFYFAPEDECTKIYMFEFVPPTPPYYP